MRWLMIIDVYALVGNMICMHWLMIIDVYALVIIDMYALVDDY